VKSFQMDVLALRESGARFVFIRIDRMKGKIRHLKTWLRNLTARSFIPCREGCNYLYGLLGCDVLSFGRLVLTFRSSLLAPSSRQKELFCSLLLYSEEGGRTFLRSVGTNVSRPKGQ
jgi:hypothetical protein